jgi:chemotaxis signal transduction protein
MTISSKNKSFSGLFIFKIQGQEFCLDLKEIINVLKLSECEIHLNEFKSELEYAGSKYKVISFDEIYKLKYKSSYDARILLIKAKKKLVGFFVDEIVEIMAIDENSSKISQLNSNDNPYIKLIVKYENRKMIVPDFEQIFSCVL